MRLLKPAWVNHDGKPIFSIDIHPDGSRFATGGQGEDSGRVAIWNMGPVRDEKEEKDENIPKILCQMNNHLACVNCVRWSNNGKSLASGGDDKLIMVWHISRYGGVSSVFGSDVQNVEQWRPAATLRGHTGDVLDLAWSGNDSWLASCSVDNTVVVWNADKFPEQIALLKGHHGLVKGVTWDPVGKYLASQSDDKSVRVWRTRDWQEEAKITEPFQECGGTTHVLRLNWSPDGAYVVSAHAMNNSGPTAQIIEREGWKSSLDFVGHRKAVTVVRFNPNIFSKKMKKGMEQSHQYTCCAIGSKDRSLSVWLTALKRPLVVTHDLFDNTILDVTWSKSGLELMACSSDGTVAYTEFSVDEIGIPMSPNDVQLFLEKIYGKCMTKNSSATNGNQIIESAALLKLQQQQKHEELQRKIEPEEKSTDSRMSTASNSPFKPTNKQIETKTADGRRRITPIFIAPQLDVNVSTEVPVPFNSGGIRFTTTKEASKIVVEKQNIITEPGLSVSTPKSSGSLSSSSPPQEQTTPTAGGDLTPKVVTPQTPTQEKKDESTVEEKSPFASNSSVLNVSIQPMAALQSKPKHKTPDHSKKDKLFDKEKMHKHKDKGTDKEKLKPLPSTPDRPDKDKLKSRMKLSTGIKRKHEGDKEKAKKGRPRKIDRERTMVHIPTPVSSHQPVEDRTEPVRHVGPAASELMLPVPSIEKSFHRLVSGRQASESSLMLEVENSVGSGIHKLQCVQKGTTIWQQVLANKIIAVAGSKYVVCAACDDASVHMYSSNGTKHFPCLVLDSKVSKLHVSSYHVMCVTHRGYLYVWNMQTKSAVIKKESLSPIISGHDTLHKSSLTTEGVPVITVTSNKSYTFSADMGSWMLLYHKGDTIQQSSDHHSCTPSKDSKTQGPLASLHSAHDRLGLQASSVFSAGQSLQQSSTLSHIESQMASCILLKSGSEYKFWLQTYIRYLAQEGLEPKIRELCDELLGPVYKTKAKSAWQPHLLGMNKRELLQEILPNIGSNLKLQRLFTEYQEQLDSIDR